ncbi:hypothetical protein MASR2M18_10980 [Ignavibacteria bacterium]|nr:formylglycine-generating enzyme family protein [Bacteroidota bacterium]
MIIRPVCAIIFTLICITALLSGCGSEQILDAIPKATIKIVSQPSAGEGVPNVDYTFTPVAENAPTKPKFEWILDDSIIATTSSAQSIHLKFPHDGWYYLRVNLYDMAQGDIIAADVFLANIRSELPVIAMINIPPGKFRMGSEKNFYEQPVRTIMISRRLAVGKYEIMQSEWRAIMGYSPAWVKGDSLPVENMSWNSAIDFCNRLSIRSGYKPCYSFDGDSVKCDFLADGYRLPSEAEWEYFARAGTTTESYTGDFQSAVAGCFPPDTALAPLAWYCANSDGTTHIAGKKQPNAFGLYDVMGNVSEFCWDFYDGVYYQYAPLLNPSGPPSGLYRVKRGGSFSSELFTMRLSYRESQYVEKTGIDIGIRVVRTLP